MTLRVLVILLGLSLAASSAWAQEQAAPGSSRLFLSPTGTLIPRGQISLTTFGLLALPVVNVGLTDRVSLAVGTIAFAPVIVGAPKVQVYRSTDTAVAAGAIHLVVAGQRQFGLVYAASTRGTADASGTVAVLLPYADGEHGPPLMMIGGERRLNQRTRFVTENFLGGHGGLLMGGVRRQHGRFTYDVGLAMSFASQFIMIGPVVSLSWRLREGH